MERLQALINKLKEQSEQNADPAIMLGTIQLIEFELTKMNVARKQSLGTPKVAVVLPMINTVGQAVGAEYEKYAPKPAEPPKEIPVKDPEVHKVKETLLVDEGSVSVVQKNGQLDMVFDPLNDIPTLSHQGKEINDMAGQTESLNDKLKMGKTELVERLKETPVKDLRKAIGINDRFLFINELFRGDENMYERCIKTINSFNIYAEAEYWISRELKVKLGWKDDSGTVQHFDQLVRRRFS
ncbi:MAG: hypothetical protein U0U70_14425 [Chitinophagaceae bacterium]